ncbi:hypothetical protein ACMU_17990 [Actibacterium mucosum KCTC 23349]|uniref:Uncharacterized protein n=1 Tax=Actibacterium mucosum KCTC 23349 TaxID=1454373 RepID=A0A037ZEM8_9RHOB|nr:hypothetical protein [Actibacterium mucosum]KAJ54597.1 hypothetical protein ACMU_17990 [Actibacterium mucosum KCTC 23349]
MINPFEGRAAPLSGPARDLLPITPDDNTDLSTVAVALFVETGGTVSFVTVAGETRSVSIGDFSILPVGVMRVLSTGTTASGLHGFLI